MTISILPPPYVAIFANQKGGVGKTLLACTHIDCLALAGIPCTVIQIDDQQRLASLIGAQVLTILPDLQEARRNPRALMAVFAPIYAACEAAAKSGSVVVIDVGANQFASLCAWLQAVDLDEDLRAWRLPVLLFVPGVAEPEALRQGAATLAAGAKALPSAKRVFVENRRNGAIADLSPHSEAAAIVKGELAPALKGVARVTMPAIEGESWQPFENASLRFIKAIAMPPLEAAALISEDVANAKVMRSDIARYFKAMQAEFGRLVALSQEYDR
ncbi:MAG: hypothetical protein LCH80_07460 [Proteobacteria bacterium]|nr:hypothetical protein [Pseudomonadota bacterium]